MQWSRQSKMQQHSMRVTHVSHPLSMKSPSNYVMFKFVKSAVRELIL